MRSSRLLSILLLLRTRHLVSAAELAERLEVSVRTVHRDVEALSTAGVPVHTLRGRHGGIGLLPGFRTDVTGLTEDEARALFVLAAQGAHAPLGLDRAFASALHKVMAALPAPHRPAAELTSRRILVDPDRWFSGGGTGTDLTELLSAVLADRRLRVRYRHGGDHPVSRYLVDPYGLVAKAGVWYLAADHRRRGRLFRADRLAGFAVTDVPVRRRPGLELSGLWAELRREVERHDDRLRVTARVRPGRLPLVRRVLTGALVGAAGPDAEAAPPAGTGPPPAGTERAGTEREWPTVEFGFRELGAVHQLLQFGPDVVVTDPPEARELLARSSAALCARYHERHHAETPEDVDERQT